MLLVLAAWILCQHLPPSLGSGCGYPGAPAFGRPHPLKETYRAGESVTYTCFQGYSQQGPFQRTCLQNGTWAPRLLPLCDVGLPHADQQASSRQTLSLYPANKSIDGDPSTCTYTDKLRPRWIRVDLKRSHRVKAVALTVPHGIYSRDVAQFTVYAISVRDSTTASYHKCASFNGKFAATTLKLLCSGGDVEGRYIHVEDDRNRIDYFSLCEMKVYVNRGVYECGEAERPAHAYSVITETGAVNYRCIYGYRLEGPHTRVCLANQGQWSLYPPKCIEILCPPLENVEHGQVYYVGRKTLTLGTVANVTCDYGYQMSGSAKICDEDGRWSEGDLSCRPVECGPPQFEPSTLLNGSTQYGSVALIQCGHLIVCREDGTWSTPHTECNSSLSKLGLVNGEQNDVPTGIVVGMATVVFVLLLAVIFILLIKRRKVLKEGTDSLPSKELSVETTYENDVFYATIPVSQSAGDPFDDKKSIMSTVLFTRKKTNLKEGQSVGQVCEDIETNSPSTETPVYAQVDLGEKRRSRLKKSFGGGRGQPTNISTCSFDEVDLEPIKLRELPPIPDGSCTYASLSVPLEPPPDKVIGCSDHIYQNSLSTSEEDLKVSSKPR